jgi:hypothetical protein
VCRQQTAKSVSEAKPNTKPAGRCSISSAECAGSAKDAPVMAGMHGWALEPSCHNGLLTSYHDGDDKAVMTSAVADQLVSASLS